MAVNTKNDKVYTTIISALVALLITFMSGAMGYLITGVKQTGEKVDLYNKRLNNLTAELKSCDLKLGSDIRLLDYRVTLLESSGHSTTKVDNGN